MIKLSWQVRCRNTELHHSMKCREAFASDKTWTIADTAKDLNRSFGSISEDLMLASWLRSHGPKLEKMKTAKEALDFIREKKKEMKVREN